jgi:hypothetical protein
MTRDGSLRLGRDIAVSGSRSEGGNYRWARSGLALAHFAPEAGSIPPRTVPIVAQWPLHSPLDLLP